EQLDRAGDDQLRELWMLGVRIVGGWGTGVGLPARDGDTGDRPRGVDVVVLVEHQDPRRRAAAGRPARLVQPGDPGPDRQHHQRCQEHERIPHAGGHGATTVPSGPTYPPAAWTSRSGTRSATTT